MEIQFYEQQKVFMLHTENTTYSMAIVDDCYLEHLYYGSKIQSPNIRYILREDEPPFVPSKNLREKEAFLDCALMEYP